MHRKSLSFSRSLAPTHSPAPSTPPPSSPPAYALLSTTGRYRIQPCSTVRPGCGLGPEFVGFNNMTCGANTSPVYDPDNTVGPMMVSADKPWPFRMWTVDVEATGKKRSVVTIKNDYPQAKCTGHYIDDYEFKKDACKGTEWSSRVHLHKREDVAKWSVTPVEGADGCYTIANLDKKPGCDRYLSAPSDCDQSHLRLVPRDNGKGKQWWRFTRVGDAADAPPTSPPVSIPPQPSGQCVTQRCGKRTTFDDRDVVGLGYCVSGRTSSLACSSRGGIPVYGDYVGGCLYCIRGGARILIDSWWCFRSGATTALPPDRATAASWTRGRRRGPRQRSTWVPDRRPR